MGNANGSAHRGNKKPGGGEARGPLDTFGQFVKSKTIYLRGHASLVSSSEILKHYGKNPQEGHTAKLVGQGADVTDDKAFIYEALEAHNRLRAKHGCPPLRWSRQCAQAAQVAANTAAQGGKLQLHDSAQWHGFGQNAFYGTTGAFGAADIVEAWYSQQTQYIWPEPAATTGFGTSKFSRELTREKTATEGGVTLACHTGTSHFTQTVWRDTLEVGMACDREGHGYVYANYWPPGNVEGLYDRNVPRELDPPTFRRHAIPVQDGVVEHVKGLQAIVSFPGKHEESWNEVVGTAQLLRTLCPQEETFSTACVWLSESDPAFGEHAQNTYDREERCFCHKLYGSVQPCGCLWFDQWRTNLQKVIKAGQTPVVVYQAHEFAEGDKLKWKDLPKPLERGRRGIGPSQVGEVAFLKELVGDNFVKAEVRNVCNSYRSVCQTKLKEIIHGDEGCKQLAKALLQCPVAQEGMRQLVLPHKSITQDGAEALADVMPMLLRLRSINLVGNNLGPEGVKSLMYAVPPQLSHLAELSLSSNNMGVEGAKALADAMEKLPGLRELSLGGNRMGTEGVVAIASVLPKLSHLENLGLADNKMWGTGAVAVAKALPDLPNLQRIVLGGNQIGKVGAEAIAQALPKLPLKYLDLSGNSIGAFGAVALSEVLPKLTSLATLDLGNNNIGADGCRALAGGLRYACTLHSLFLGSNAIGEAGAEALAQVLEQVPTLSSLWLQSNGIGPRGGLALLSSVRTKGRGLEKLALYGNCLEEAGEQLEEAVAGLPKWVMLKSRGDGRVHTIV